METFLSVFNPINQMILASFGSWEMFIGIIIIGAIGWCFIKFRRDFGNFAQMYSSEVLTTLGILGCFVSIGIGLLSFDTSDTKNIGSSVIRIIGGLKWAFFVSGAVIYVSLPLKLNITH